MSRVVLVAALLVLTASACGGGEKAARETTTIVTTVKETENPTGTASDTTGTKNEYPPVVVNNFMKSCTNGMQNRRAYCACTLDRLSTSVSVRDFVQIGLAGGKLPPRIRRAIQQAALDCADKIQG